MYKVLLSGQSILMQSFSVTAIRGRHLSFTLLSWCLNKDRLLLGLLVGEADNWVGCCGATAAEGGVDSG